MAGRGRGRGLTLPAWMTNGTADAAPPTVAISTNESTTATNASVPPSPSSSASTSSNYNNAPSSSSNDNNAPSSNHSNNGEQYQQMNKVAASQFLQSEINTPTGMASSAPPPKPRARTVHIGSAPPSLSTSAPIPSQYQQYQQPQQPQYLQQQYQQQFPPAYPPSVFTTPVQPPHMAFPHPTQTPPQAQSNGGYPQQMFQQPPTHMLQQPHGPPFLPPGGLGGPRPMMLPPPRGLPPPTASPAEQTLNDPLNDVKSWSEHVAEADKRVYWHNKITKTSTYDKPACLQCPEERSIPPCRWKEYSKDGKLYYSTGKGEASWTMPEEFREWKARVEAAVERFKARKASAAADLQPPPRSQSSLIPNAHVPEEVVGAGDRLGMSEQSQPSLGTAPAATHTSTVASTADVKEVAEKTPEAEVVTYATEKEAVAAFKQLLADHDVSHVMKFKDVQELCSQDARWTACKSVGARKQALSEYQTQKMKTEREEKRLQTRKKRDMFFQLLAETTAIDGRTRWREAQELLQDSRRYKQIEDDRERESYFTEFVIELAKKEKEDLEALKKIVKVNYVAILDDLFAAGKVKRNAIWADVKDDILGRLDSTLNMLDDADKRHMFQDYMLELENRLRGEEKAAQEQYKRRLKEYQGDFRTHLQSLVATGALSTQMKWREVKPTLVTHPTFVSLLKFVGDNDPRRTGPGEKDKDKDASTSVSSSIEGGPRDVFDDVLATLVQEEREDRRLLRRVFEDGLEVSSRRKHKHNDERYSDSEDERSEEVLEQGVLVDQVRHDTNMLKTKTQLEKFVVNADITEDNRIFKYKAPLAEILTNRLHNFENIFNVFVAEKVEELAIKEKKQRKYEDRYLDLLDDFYYRSDHVGLQWEEAKKDLSRKSAYLDLSRELRKSLFLNHMQELEAELAKKSTSSSDNGKVIAAKDSQRVEQEEGEIDVDSVSEKTADDTRGRKRSASRSHSRSPSPYRSRSRSRSASQDKRRSSSSQKREKDEKDRHGRERTRSKDRDTDKKHSHSRRHSGDSDGDRRPSKRKRHDSSIQSDDSDVDDMDSVSGRERKSKKSKKEKKEKKSHKHSHKHRSHRDRSHDRRT